jgi:hypothetical protein
MDGALPSSRDYGRISRPSTNLSSTDKPNVYNLTLNGKTHRIETMPNEVDQNPCPPPGMEIDKDGYLVVANPRPPADPQQAPVASQPIALAAKSKSKPPSPAKTRAAKRREARTRPAPQQVLLPMPLAPQQAPPLLLPIEFVPIQPMPHITVRLNHVSYAAAVATSCSQDPGLMTPGRNGQLSQAQWNELYDFSQ